MYVHVLAAAKKVALIRVSWVQWSMSITRKKLEIEFGRWSQKFLILFLHENRSFPNNRNPIRTFFVVGFRSAIDIPKKLNFDLFIIQQ
jgi:hypothetical protein